MAINKGVWYGVGMAILAGGMAITYVATKPDKSAERESIVPAQSINISTSGEVPLTFQFSTATADIQYLKTPKNAQERNLLDPVWLAQMRSYGFQRAILFSDGSIANYAYPNTTGTGKGYNAKQSDFYTEAEFRDWGNGVLVAAWQSDFHTKTIDFINAWGIPCDVVLNKKNTWAQNKWLIDRCTGEYIKLAGEVLATNAEPDQWTWEDYLSWAKKTRDSIVKYYGTTKKIIADEPVIYKASRAAVEWRYEINPTTLTGMYGADSYFQIDPDILNFTANQDSNVIRAKNYFDSVVPAQIAQFQREFPGWKMIIGETLIEDNRDGNVIHVNKNIVGVYIWSEFFRVFIKNQATIPFAVQMSLRNMSDPLDNHVKIISRLNKLLVPTRKVTTVTFTGLEGCTGWSAHEGKAHYVAINNSSRNTYSLPEIFVNGGRKTPTYTAIHYTSTDWYSVVQIDSTVSESYDIKPGVTILNFTLK